MEDSMSDVRGQFVWYDLMTTDPGAARDFYQDIIGWGTQAWEGSETPYTMWTVADRPVGGVMELPEEARAGGAPPHWLPYVGTPDVGATLARATELGGTVYVPPTDIPDVGQFAVLADPQGAVFAVFKPAGEHPTPPGPGQNGDFSWHELATTDYEAAFTFYQDLFGWEKTDAMDMGEAGMYQMYGLPGSEHPLGGMFSKPPEMPGPAAWLCYTTVADVTPASERVKELGGQVLNGPMEVPGGDMIAACMDPQGAMFALHSAGNGSEAG
jgi:predicted enzyme related to lactoylglutathione lyase